jgi:hypothetical protein
MMLVIKRAAAGTIAGTVVAAAVRAVLRYHRPMHCCVNQCTACDAGAQRRRVSSDKTAAARVACALCPTASREALGVCSKR